MQRNMRPGIAMALKTELAACRHRMNVIESRNTEFYDDIAKETVSVPSGRYLSVFISLHQTLLPD